MPSHPLCPRQMVFSLSGVPGVQITATEIGTTIHFEVDVFDSAISTGDLRALFFHINEAKLAGLNITPDTGISTQLLTQWLAQANKVIDLDDGANLSGKVKTGFDVGLEWGTPGGKKDDISFPVSFTLSNTAGALTLDDIGGLLFGAKLDSIGGPGGPRGSTAKLTAIAPHAPDANDDVKNIFEDNAPDPNTPSKSPTAVWLDVLANDTDNDTSAVNLVVKHIIEGFGPAHGDVEIINNKLYYTPDLDFAGTDTFWYCMTDGAGNQDSAMVTVNIAAVADDPLVRFSVARGAAINQTLVTVTATQNDADGSEDIVDFNWSIPGGVPAGANVVETGPLTGSGDEVSQIFLVTTEMGRDWDFGIDFTATAREDTPLPISGIFDTETHTETQQIKIDFTENQSDFDFSTTDRSIWGSGSGVPFDANPFIGIQDLSLTFDLPPVFPLAPLPLPFLDIDVSGSATFGFNTVIHLDAGKISANLFVTAKLDTTYNKTTDTFFAQTSYILTGGNFVANGPNGFVKIDFEVDIHGNFNVALEPLDYFTGWANVDVPFALDPPVDEEILNITTDFSETWPLPVPGATMTLSWPDLLINNPDLSGSMSDNILEVNVDLDAAAAYYFPPAIVLSDPIPGTDVDPQLLDLDVSGYVAMVQDLTVNLKNLVGTLTFEGAGPAANFTFGEALPFFGNANALDADRDGNIEFSLAINPDVTLTSESKIEFGVGASLYLFLDLPFGLPAIKVFDEQLPLADLTVFKDEFGLVGFNNANWDLLAVA